MKIVDKYELSKVPNGTPFYELDSDGNITGSLQFIEGHYEWEDNSPHFNGVVYLEPDNIIDGGAMAGFAESVPDSFDLFCVDTSDIDFDDEDKFLMLNKEDLKVIIDYLDDVYKRIGGQCEASL